MASPGRAMKPACELMLTMRPPPWSIITPAMSSTVVAGWAIWTKPGLDWIWHSASALATIVAITVSIVDPYSALKKASSQKGAWFAILKDYEFLWAELPSPSEEEIRWGISGNLCRCTGYNKIVEAIEYAADKLQSGEAEEVAQ